MLVLLRNGTRRISDVARWLFLLSILVTVAVALLSISGPVGTADITPNAYWEFGGRSISKADTLYLSTLTRSSGLMLGAAFAMIWRPIALMRGPMRHKARLLDGVGVLGLVGMFALMWTVGFISDGSVDPFLFRGGMFLAGVFTLMVIAGVTHRRSLVSKAISVPVLMWVGTRSYGIYLYHWPIYQIIRESAGVHLELWEFALAMVLTGIITELSFRLVETPIRKGVFGRNLRRASRSGDRGERGFILAGAAIGTAVAVFAGASLATAELKQNELTEILGEADAATCNVLADPNCGQAPTDSVFVGSETDDPTGTAEPTVAPPVGTDGLPEAVTVPSVVVEATTPTSAAPAPIARLALGDSVMKGAANQLAALGFVPDAEESRQFQNGADTVQTLRDQGRLGDIVVVHLGTNGNIAQSDMTRLMEALAGVPQVLLLTIDVDRAWTPGNNALIYDTVATYPNVQLLDWAGLDDGCPGDCFASDGFHLRTDGQNYYAALIAEALGIQ
jgi:hypothetical protein